MTVISRIGKLPVKIARGVKVASQDGSLAVEGPKGKLTLAYPDDLTVTISDDEVVIARQNESKRARSLHGLYRSLVNNMVIGVSAGFSKTLTVVGVGYRAETQGQRLILNLGYSSPVEYRIPKGITVSVEGNTKVVVSGANKQQVGQVSAEIRATRPPEHYKGKGVRYEDEYVRIKPGMTGVV